MYTRLRADGQIQKWLDEKNSLYSTYWFAGSGYTKLLFIQKKISWSFKRKSRKKHSHINVWLVYSSLRSTRHFMKMNWTLLTDTPWVWNDRNSIWFQNFIFTTKCLPLLKHYSLSQLPAKKIIQHRLKL